MKRAAGVLLPLFSLPSAEGRGCLDKNAYKFIDWLAQCHQSYWQLLPIGPTLRYANPYSAFSSFGGDSAFISLQNLEDKKLIKKGTSKKLQTVDDLNLFRESKEHLIKENLLIDFRNDQNFIQFCQDQCEWLDNFSVFTFFTQEYSRPWTLWPMEIRHFSTELINDQKNRSEVLDIKLFQWLFSIQWNEIKQYAHKKSIQLIGDIPIYVDHHSVDLWTAIELFKLEQDGTPQCVSGAPPDQFSQEGQVWNTPIFNWPMHQQEHFKWWRKRIAHIFSLFDIVRIDHFRGLEAYWEIPYKETPDAREGRWVSAPGKQLFESILQEQNYPLIIEDLGDIDDKVRALRDHFQFPGMKILQFAFDTDHSNEYLPHNIESNSIIYTGTHDNDTTLSWFNNCNEKQKENLKKECQITNASQVVWKLIETALMSNSDTAIIPMADILELNSEGRINVPGKAKDNWSWRFSWTQLSSKASEKLKHLTNQSRRH